MTEKSGYAQGEPSWVDVSSSDVPATRTFYATLLGWRADDVPMDDAGGYGMFTLDGRYVGGYGPAQMPGATAWSVYFATDDLDAMLDTVRGAGGTVVAGPVDVYTSGRMAVLQDPAGAFFSLWEAGDHKGAQVQDEAGALTWVELTTTDVEGAKRFYGEVFGWGEETSEAGGPMPYTEFKQGGRSVAGMMAKSPDMPADVPPYWMPYFQPADIDKLVGEAAALGATVMVPPSPIPGGTFAILRDPQGAAFGLFKPETATPTEP
ncbi:MAG TPA: VOC family protein [Frankiaceae bacterium]|jgi:hypothetical protein|nr:VOC family protein [Frankiaceae bacterium]